MQEGSAQTLPRGEFTHFGTGIPCERDFKNAEQTEPEDEDCGDEAHEDFGILELEAPVQTAPCGFERDDRPAQAEEKNEDTRCKCQAELKDAFGLLSRLLGEAEDLQRNDRKHARHQIQKQSAEESAPEHRHQTRGGGGRFRRGWGRISWRGGLRSGLCCWECRSGVGLWGARGNFPSSSVSIGGSEEEQARPR